MMELQKKKILLIPGWWPCRFFMDPSELLNDIYDTYVLKGECTPLPLRRIYRYAKCIITKSDKSNIVDIHMSWVLYKTQWARKKQFEKHIGDIDKAVKELMGNEMPNIVSLQSLSDISPFVVEWAHRNGIKVIMTEHQLCYWGIPLLNSLHALKYSVYKKVDKLLCVSNYQYRNFIINECAKYASVIGNLVDDYSFEETQCGGKNNHRIIFVTGHPHSKDIHILYEVALLLQANTDIEIDIVGMDEQRVGSDGKTLGYHIKDKKITNLHCLGSRSHDELLRMYSYYAMALSTSCSETFGISMAEAIMHGLPVVCTDNGGCHEYVHDSNGIITSIREPQQIYEAILQVMQNIQDGKYNPQEMSAEIRNKYGRKAYRERIQPIYEQYTK